MRVNGGAALASAQGVRAKSSSLTSRDRAEPLLSGRVPDLQLGALAVDHDLFDLEVDAVGVLLFVEEEARTRGEACGEKPRASSCRGRGGKSSIRRSPSASHPMVVMKLGVNESSAKRRSRQLFPTPVGGIVFGEVGGDEMRGRARSSKRVGGGCTSARSADEAAPPSTGSPRRPTSLAHDPSVQRCVACACVRAAVGPTSSLRACARARRGPLTEGREEEHPTHTQGSRACLSLSLRRTAVADQQQLDQIVIVGRSMLARPRRHASLRGARARETQRVGCRAEGVS